MGSRGRYNLAGMQVGASGVVLTVLMGFLLSGSAVAAPGEATFTASVDRTEVGLGQTLTLTLSLSLPDQGDARGLRLPPTGSLRVISQHQQQNLSFNIQGGRQQFLKILKTVVVLQPTEEGVVTIGQARVQLGGQELTTDPIQITVGKANPQPKRPTRRSPLAGNPFSGSPFGKNPFDNNLDDFFRSPFDDLLAEPEVQESDLILWVVPSPDPATVYEGQQLTVSLMVAFRVPAGNANPRWPKLDGFTIQDRQVSDSRPEQKVLNGVPYTVQVVDRKVLFPLNAGEFTLPPIELNLEVGASPFFGRQTRTLKTRPLKITVQELPPQGRPKDFHVSHVGQFEMRAQLDTSEAKLNQPVTLSVLLSGSGNLPQIRPPEINLPASFKRFDPSIDLQLNPRSREIRGTKKFEIVLVPLASGSFELPSLLFSYFDPVQAQYKTLTSPPIPLKVAASEGSAPNAIGNQEVNWLGGTLKPIRFDSQLEGFGQPFAQSPAFWPCVWVPAGLWLLGLLVMRLWAQLQRDSPRSRLRRLAQSSRQHLKQAHRVRAEGRSVDFFAELKSSLLDGLEARLGQTLQGLRLDELRLAVRSAGGSVELTEALVREIENCDFGRFAPARQRGDEMDAALERATRLLARLHELHATGEPQ